MQENKALVEISVPSINRSFDAYIPLDCKMCDVLMLVANTIKELSDSVFLPNEETVLCDYETGNIYDGNRYISELNISNGSKLLMI